MYREPEDIDYIKTDKALKFNIFDNARTRLFTAMNQYYALKSAIIADAKLYRVYDSASNLAFNDPPHYVSTIDLEK